MSSERDIPACSHDAITAVKTKRINCERTIVYYRDIPGIEIIINLIYWNEAFSRTASWNNNNLLEFWLMLL